MKKLASLLVLPSLLLGAPSFADDTADLWKAKCKSCHGDAGAADTPNGKKHKVPDMTTAQWHAKNDDAKIERVIADGVADTKMKGYKEKLEPAEISALVRFIRTLKK